MKNLKTFKDYFISESSIMRHYNMDIKKKVAIADLKIGQSIKFLTSTSVYRRIIPNFDNKVAGHGDDYFLKGEIFEFINYWTDFARDGGFSLDYHETVAMEFECKESPKSKRIGTKIVLSLRHFNEYKEKRKFTIL